MWKRSIVFIVAPADVSDEGREFAGLIGRVKRTPVAVLAMSGSDKDDSTCQEDAEHKAAMMSLESAHADAQVLREAGGMALTLALTKLGANLVTLRYQSRSMLDRILTGSRGCAVLILKNVEPVPLTPGLAHQAPRLAVCGRI